MKPRNEIERKALDMLQAGVPVHGQLKDILTDMQLRELDEQGMHLPNSKLPEMRGENHG